MLAADFAGGVLEVNGTGFNDVIELTLSGNNEIAVTVSGNNGFEFNGLFSAENTNSIVVNGLEGLDFIDLSGLNFSDTQNIELSLIHI